MIQPAEETNVLIAIKPSTRYRLKQIMARLQLKDQPHTYDTLISFMASSLEKKL